MTFAASLGTLIPVLQLVMSADGPRARVQQLLIADRFGISVEVYDADKHGEFTTAEMGAALVIAEVDVHSPNYALIKEGMAIIPQAGTITELEFIDDLSSASNLPVVSLTQHGASETIQLHSTALGFLGNLKGRGLETIAGWIPPGRHESTKRATLKLIFAALFVMVLIGAVCRFLAEYTTIIVSNRAVMDMRRDLYRTLMNVDITWFGRHLSETMSRSVTDFKDVERGYRSLFGKLTTEPVKVVVLLAVALSMNWVVTAFAMILVPLCGAMIALLGKKIRKANRKLLAGYAQMMGVINTTLSGMRVVRAYNKQDHERRRMWIAERVLFRRMLRIGRLEAMTSPLLEVIVVLLIIAGVHWLAGDVFTGQLNAGTFIYLVAILATMFDAMRKIAAVYPRIARADGAAARVFQLMDMQTEDQHGVNLPSLPALKNSITFDQVTYEYPGSDRPALDGFSFCVSRGQKIAIVGPNGSGKTTLVSMLERFLECSGGRILFDDRDIREYSVRSLRSQISLVSQDAIVFAASAHDNIAYGKTRSSAEQVIGAAKRAHAHEFIDKLPDSYETILGEFGATLSGGERQRLALARAILRDAPIFILDEATSQIDADSEAKIQAATSEFMKGRTSFVIAHRIGTITDADAILVLDRGRLVDAGTHETLIERCSLYQNLYRSYAHPT